MKKLSALLTLLFFVAPSLWAKPTETVSIENLVKNIKKYNGKIVTLRGVISTQGTMHTGKNTGYQYYNLTQKGASIQVRYPLSISFRPGLDSKMEVTAKVVITPYGYYLKLNKQKVTGKVKRKQSFFGMDKNTAKKMDQAMKMLDKLGKLRGFQQKLKRGLRGFGIKPEELLQKNLPKILNTLKEMGIDQEEVLRFLQKGFKIYKQLQRQISALLREYGPAIKKVQREMMKRIQRAMRNRSFFPRGKGKGSAPFRKLQAPKSGQKWK